MRLNINFLKIQYIISIITLIGCTSVGHKSRTEPQIELPLKERPHIIAVEGAGELPIALELMLVSKGIDVVASPFQVSKGSQNTSKTEMISRYVIKANSVDHDMCVPEGSRQMHFHIAVVDLVDNNRIFAMNGDYGCKNTIVNRFKRV